MNPKPKTKPTPNTGGIGKYDDDSALVTVKEPGVYRVKWDVGANRFKLIPVELGF
jgi:hypothetical protein